MCQRWENSVSGIGIGIDPFLGLMESELEWNRPLAFELESESESSHYWYVHMAHAKSDPRCTHYVSHCIKTIQNCKCCKLSLAQNSCNKIFFYNFITIFYSPPPTVSDWAINYPRFHNFMGNLGYFII